jgi:ATP-dependent RNA helicase RhlE
LKNPETVSIIKKNVTDSIEQDIVPCAQDKKFETLVSLLQQDDFTKVIIFGEMKHSVEKLARNLKDKNIKAESIHGNKSHGQRQRSLQNMKHGKANVLVATDVAARGIHIDDISHVINYDMPQTFEDYVHRIGRTGRGDKYGKALTFVPEK